MLKGAILGFSIAAPVGPIGVLCIRRTLTEGRLYGLVTGLGAASADAFYGFIAAFGLTFISTLLVNLSPILSLAGGLFLVYLGIKTFRARPAEDAASTDSRRGLIGAFGSTLFLTLTNPLTILSFVGFFAGAGIASSVDGRYGLAAAMVLGVFVGSAAWWLLLSGGVSLLRRRFNTRWLVWVNRFSGVIVTVFGLLALASLF
ncbi:MAG: LysE family transporter [bacterium]|nr:LysE family transporter [bacterium]